MMSRRISTSCGQTKDTLCKFFFTAGWLFYGKAGGTLNLPEELAVLDKVCISCQLIYLIFCLI
jgi:hypothetical protein